MAITIFTLGFTRKNAETFFGLLRRAKVRRLVDVRLHNVSQLAGFTKRDDLAWFARSLCRADYLHALDLAPTPSLLEGYRGNPGGWEAYAKSFRALIARRRIEETFRPALLDGSCLLCSEESPHHCHRRLVAEHLQKHWRNVRIVHLGAPEV